MGKIITEADVLGGTKILGQNISSRMDFHHLILKGISVGVVTHIKKEFGLFDDAIGLIIGVSGKTVSARRHETLVTPGIGFH